MSADLITYFNFIASMENATDDQINDIISERANFMEIGKMSNMMDTCNGAIDSVFDEIDRLAKQLEDEQIADDSVKIAEDVTAVTSIWSFGLSMAAYLALEAVDLVLQVEIKRKEDELNSHLASADADISNQIGGACEQYISLTKKNNKFLKACSPDGLSAQTGRSYLYNYMDLLEAHAGGVTLENFRKYIEVTKGTKDNSGIDGVYDLLDNFSSNPDHNNVDVIKKVLQDIGEAVEIVDQVVRLAEVIIKGCICHILVTRVKISVKSLNKAGLEVEISFSDTDLEKLERMEKLDKGVECFGIFVAVVDAVLDAYNIHDTYERYKKNIAVFQHDRQQYKDFYQQIYNASINYMSKPSQQALPK